MSRDEFNLNNKTNLNPELNAIRESVGYKPLPKVGETPSQPNTRKTYFPTAGDLDSARKVEMWKKGEKFPDGTPVMTPEGKKEYVDYFNGNGTVKQNGIKAIDETRERPVSRRKYNWMRTLATLGVIALVIIAGAVAVFAYLAYQDGTLLAQPSMLICGNTTVNVEPTQCPTCPTCPSLPTIPKCPDAPDVKVYCGNQTS